MNRMMEPLAVYDVSDGSYQFDVHHKPLSGWLAPYGVELTDLYRIEVYLIDCPSARLFGYERDADGRILWDQAAKGPKKLPPRELPVSSLPPLAPRDAA